MLMASQQVFSAISRICIIGMGLLGVRPIGAGLYFCDLSKQKGKQNTKTKHTKQNKTKQLIKTLINYYTNSASIFYTEILD